MDSGVCFHGARLATRALWVRPPFDLYRDARNQRGFSGGIFDVPEAVVSNKWKIYRAGGLKVKNAD